MRRRLFLLVLAITMAPALFAYYHWIIYPNRGVYVPVFTHFDLRVLPNQTVPLFVSEIGVSNLTLGPGDSYNAVLSEIRTAANTWNTVATAAIKVQFNGVFTPGNKPGVTMNSPAIEVIFDDLPPYWYGFGGPMVTGTLATDANGTFTPIITSRVVLERDFTRDTPARPSWSEAFFLTAVHEIGHALGLQHSYASSVMSTDATRAVTKARPLGADDAAGLSVLYPTPKFLATTGSVSGRVTLGGAGVALASVVALSPGSDAVTTLTAPDGTYRIDGLPAGSYFVYAHPLPPFDGEGGSYGVNVQVPQEAGTDVTPGPYFNLQFYPNSTTPTETVFVTPAQVLTGIDFAVTQRSSLSIYDVVTYSYINNQTLVKPGYLLQTAATGTVYLTSALDSLSGLIASQAPVPGLSGTLVGGAESLSPLISYQESPDYYLQFDVKMNMFAGPGPRHLLVSKPGESYVLPSAFVLVKQQPPSFQVTANPDHTVTLTGTSLSAQTQVWFDGAQAKTSVNSDGSLNALVPGGTPGSVAHIVAFNTVDQQSNVDGQSSLFASAQPQVYTFDQGAAPSIQVSPSAVPSGVETVIEVDGTGTAFANDGNSAVGFGTSDVTVERTWVLGPGRMLANIAVNPSALQSANTVTAAAGVQFTTLADQFLLTGASPRTMYIPFSTLAGFYAYPGSTVTLPVAGAGILSAPTIAATWGGISVIVLSTSGNQVTFQTPANMALGPAVLQMTVNGTPVLPIVLPVDAPPPVILSAANASGTIIDVTHPAVPGDTINLIVSGLADPGASVDISRVRVTAGGMDQQVLQVTPNTTPAGTHTVQFVLSVNTPRGSVTNMVVTIDNRVSLPYAFTMRDDIEILPQT